jgi:hypothetical protein
VVKISRTLAALCLSAFLATTALAEKERPKPPPELDQIKFFIGSWKCDFKIEPGPMGPGGTEKGTVTIEPDLDGFFLAGVYLIPATKTHPTMKTRFYLGYDRGAKQFLFLGVDNMGGWMKQSSPGFEGDKIVYPGEISMMNKTLKGRTTFIKQGDGELTFLDELGDGKGGWTKMDEGSCRKMASER